MELPSDRVRSFTRRPWVRTGLDFVWPRMCWLCEISLQQTTHEAFCSNCRTDLSGDSLPSCLRCSSTVGPHTETADGCPRCAKETYRFRSTTRLGIYAGLLREAVLKCKQPTGESLAEHLGELFAEQRRDKLLARAPQIIVPIPLHWQRRWLRWFNQAEAIGRGLARGLGLPIESRAIRRTEPTPKLADLTGAERRALLKDSMARGTVRGIRGLRILLVDDVLTTGATADAASRVLLEAGAAQVDVAVLAHR